MRISDIPLENRPRARFQRYGESALNGAEILAIMLQKGTKEENVRDMSNRLISKYGIDKLSELSLKELQEITGKLSSIFHYIVYQNKVFLTGLKWKKV